MSGIFGIVRPPGAAVQDSELALMADVLKHRGPHGIRYSARDNAGLGHCMLQATPESLQECLPLRDPASGLLITADARIDNRKQLMASIPITASGARVVTDGQLILAAYLKWGEDCVEHLLGDFVFAVWDANAHSLFVARDQLGCKPLYYHQGNGLFVFASSAIAVARVGEVNATLNEGRLADYLVQELEGFNKTCSWYNEINRLPPAHCGHYRNDSLGLRRYWALEPAELGGLTTDEDYLQAFTGIYTEAVRCRLRCHGRAASMLSGGLDSSTVVALARDLLVAQGKPPLRTYSGIVGPGENCAETRSIEAILAQGQLESTCLQPSDIDDHMAALTAAMAPMEDPFDGGWTLLALLFLRAAQDEGRVLLSGVDGDYAVGAPTDYLHYLLRQGLWRRAWQEARGFSRHYYRDYYSPGGLYLRALCARLAPRSLRACRRKLTNVREYRRLLGSHNLAPGFARRIGFMARVRAADCNRVPDPVNGLQNWQLQTLQSANLTVALERYERIAGYFGVEARHPLLDIRLLQFSCAVPLQQKVRDGWSKYLLRGLAAQRLPPSVAWREGWEGLGWLFTRREAQQFANHPGLPVTALEQSLQPYLVPGSLACYQQEPVLGWDAEQLHRLWTHYRFWQWRQGAPRARGS